MLRLPDACRQIRFRSLERMRSTCAHLKKSKNPRERSKDGRRGSSKAVITGCRERKRKILFSPPIEGKAQVSTKKKGEIGERGRLRYGTMTLLQCHRGLELEDSLCWGAPPASMHAGSSSTETPAPSPSSRRCGMLNTRDQGS